MDEIGIKIIEDIKSAKTLQKLIDLKRRDPAFYLLTANVGGGGDLDVVKEKWSIRYKELFNLEEHYKIINYAFGFDVKRIENQHLLLE